MDKNIYILAIETSCDETSVSILKNTKVLSNIISSQKIHSLFGGVVPELASREHEKLIIPVVEKALLDSKIPLQKISAIAYTRGPGLMGALLVGTSFAKSLSLSLDIPLVEVNHMQAHILSVFIDDNEKKPEFPFLALTVSGGHTQLVLVKNYLKFVQIGTTLDDAAGEAFDKCGKLLGLDYPSGPKIDFLSKSGNENKFDFNKPKIDGLNFSFSGLKTSFKYFLQNKQDSFVKNNLNDLCASLQKVIVDILREKILNARDKTKIKNIVVCGGVSANSYLRKQLLILENDKEINLFIPNINYSTDNAAMIGVNGYFKFVNSKFGKLSDVSMSKYPI